MNLYALRDKETGELQRIPKIDAYAAPLETVAWVYPVAFPANFELIILRAEPVEYCKGCMYDGKYEKEFKTGQPSPCTRCRRRASDNYKPSYDE